VGVRLRRSVVEDAGGVEPSIEEWSSLDEVVLVSTRSRKVCMTCHWFRHHAGVNCIPVLTCKLHQGLIAMVRQWGWAPVVT
jgi:hypothetical protein